MNDLSSVADLAEIIGVIIVVGGLFFALIQMRQTRQQRRELAAIELFRFFGNPRFTAAYKMIMHLPDGMSAEDIRMKQRDLDDAAMLISATMENIGVMTFQRIVPFTVVNNLIGASVVILWRKLEPCGRLRCARNWTRRRRSNGSSGSRNAWSTSVTSILIPRTWRTRAGCRHISARKSERPCVMSDAAAPLLLDIRDATIYRGTTKVFENFSLQIARNEPVAILGPNGSGKTTLLKLINREIYPAHVPGSAVKILGKDRWNVWDLRAHIGIVSHDLQAHYRDSITGLDAVLSGFHSSIGVHGALAGRITALQREQAIAIMADLGVAEFAATPLRNMSTGQQRRCLLARALVHDPHTLILDEPTAGLDIAAAFDYLDRIRQLSQAGRNIVLVTHLLNEIPPEIDRVVLLRSGRIVADGAKDSVLTPANLASAYQTSVRVTEIDGYFLAYPPARD